MRFRAVLTDPDLHPVSEDLEAGLKDCNVTIESRLCSTERELAEFCAGADAVLCARARITRNIIRAMPNCRIIARLGSGYDNIDVKAASEAGIPVTNVPDFCTQEVADHTIALILACSRKLISLTNDTRRGLWNPNAVMPAHRISGQVLGLVGFGKIGCAVAQRALAFGMRVTYFDIACSSSANPSFHRCDSLEQCLRAADIVSLHLPLNERNQGFFGRREFQQMKPAAIFINCARGGLVVEDDLIQALKAGAIAGAALDTLQEEPPKVSNVLLRLPNVIITPHCAAHTVEALDDLRKQAYANVARALRGGRPANIVNQKHLEANAGELAQH